MEPIRRALQLAPLCAASFVLLAGANALADPPNDDLATWRGPCYNCMNYAFDNKNVFFAQIPDPPPGGYTCDFVRNYATAAPPDGLGLGDQPAGPPVPPSLVMPCNGADCMVALFAHGGVPGLPEGDFHWARRNADGTWSQKHGSAPATDADDAGDAMSDTENPPHDAVIDDLVQGPNGPVTVPYEFCGYYCFPSSPTLAGVGVWTAADILRSWRIRRAGREDRQKDLDDIEETQSHLPTSSSVPEPDWVSTGEPGGYGLAPGIAVAGFPPYLRVYQGVVAYYDDLDGSSITYYADDNGLEAYLAAQFDSDPIPAVSAWDLAAGALLLPAAGWLARRRWSRRRG